MLYKNSIKILDNDITSDILSLLAKYGSDEDRVFLVGSVADKLISNNIETNIIYRDKFKDIDYIYLGNNQELLYELRKNRKYDCLNSFLNKNIYKIDSSLAEVIYDIKNEVAWFSDGYMDTITTGWLYPPVWYKNCFEDVFQKTIDCPDKAFQRCRERGLKLSDEMIFYMNCLIQYIWDLDSEWVKSCAIINPNYNADLNQPWSNLWREIFEINKTEQDIENAKLYINKNKKRLYFK